MTPTTSTTDCAPSCSGIDDIAAVPLPGRIIGEIRAAYPGLDDHRLVHELIRQLIGLLIDDVVAETGRRLAALAPRSADDVRRAPSPVAGFSPGIGEADRAIKSFLKTRMYRHARVMQRDGPGRRRRARPVRALQRASPTICRRSGRRGSPASMRRRARGASPISSPA